MNEEQWLRGNPIRIASKATRDAIQIYERISREADEAAERVERDTAKAVRKWEEENDSFFAKLRNDRNERNK